MGVIEFFVICLVLVVLGYLATRAMAMLAPGHPPIVDAIIWFVVIFVILMLLAQATGILGYDPQIPRVRH